MDSSELNLSKSSLMWFSIKPSTIVATPIVSVVSKQRYLGVIFDSQLKWTHHVASMQEHVLLAT